MQKFHESLSEQTVYLRYFQPLKLSQRAAHERLVKICFNDYDREIALVAERHGAEDGAEREIVAVGRLSKRHALNGAEVAVVVGDQFQGQGLGAELLERLVRVARDEKLAWISLEIQADNLSMQRVASKVGFTLDPEENGRVRARMFIGV
jgi:acetyltransferase